MTCCDLSSHLTIARRGWSSAGSRIPRSGIGAGIELVGTGGFVASIASVNSGGYVEIRCLPFRNSHPFGVWARSSPINASETRLTIKVEEKFVAVSAIPPTAMDSQ